MIFAPSITMTDLDFNSSDFLFDLRSATRDVLGMYWDMVTTYSGFGHSVDTGSLNFLRFVDLPVEQADPSILEELQLVRIGSAIAILCQVHDSWLEYDKFPADSPYYRAIAEALESGRFAHLPELETAVRAGLASFASFRAAAHPLYEKYVVGYFLYLAGQGADPNAPGRDFSPGSRGGRRTMKRRRVSTRTESVLDGFAAQAIQLGAGEIEIEYKDGYEHVFALKDGFGAGIGSLSGSTAEAKALRSELRSLIRRKRTLAVGQVQFELRATKFESFGETAFRVKIRRL